MLHRMIALALLVLVLPTAAFADPPERAGAEYEAEYEEDVILLPGSFNDLEPIEQDGVDAAATAESGGEQVGSGNRNDR